jgi:serine/threonine-protein kinase
VPAPLSPGTVIDRYRIESVLGAGSMGDVFLAKDIELGRRVALKILSHRHRDNKELRARFTREARAVAAISHPNVVQVFTTGSYDDRPYLAMEFLDGIDLGTDVRDRGPWGSLQAARAIRDAARGLAAAARAGLIHRDVKPSNLVILRDGVVKVTDFGLAKPVDPGDEPALTAMGVVVGTPDYIAPEQARGDAIDERVDIYALGGTLYFLLTGTPPFRTGKKDDDKYLKVVARHLRDPAPDPRKRSPEVEADLAELTLQLLAKKAADRPEYPELDERLSALIDRLAAAGGDAVRPIGEPSGAGGTVSPTPFVGGDGGGRARDGDDSDGGSGESDAASTRVRPSGGGSSGIGSHPGGPRRSPLLIAVTVVCGVVFLAGLGLLLFGPMPEPQAAVESAADAAPQPKSAVPDAGPPAGDPVPPAGMLLIRHADGRPRAFVDARAVSWADLGAMFKKVRKPSWDTPKDPATKVSWEQAQSFARARGKRLVRTDEWAAASALEDFTPAGKTLWEWIDDGGGETRPLRSVRSINPAKPLAQRPPKGHADVAFRLAKDL